MSPRSSPAPRPSGSSNQRLTIWYGLLILVLSLMIVRLFYLQIIKHDYYASAALADQQKEYTIPAKRGVIKVHDSGGLVPLVLNEEKYTLFADPVYVKEPAAAAKALAAVTAGSASDYETAILSADSRYVVLAKRLSGDQKNRIEELKLKGIGLQPGNYRTYPQGNLASQLLGFVNDDAVGRYGIEQALNDKLAGQPGRLKAITDVEGVPLAASGSNIQIAPKAGSEVVLTIELSMQKQLERILKAGLERSKSVSGSALILDPNTGAIKAMANLPSYNPAEYYKVEDQNLFNNASVSSPLEVGSVMKVLTAAAGLDMGVIKPDTTFYDPGKWRLNDHDITNIEEVGGAGTRTIPQVLDKSINTGASWILMQMGGKTGEVSKTARERWHARTE